MTLAALIQLALQVSIVVIVFAMGVAAETQDAFSLLRQPGRLLRSLLSMNIIMPVGAGVLALAFTLNPAVKIALIALSVSPVPPVLPNKELKAGGRASYAIGLLVLAAAVAILFVPVAVALFGRLSHVDAHMTSSAIALLVLETVLLPLTAGLLVSRLVPQVAERIARPVSRVGTALLIASLLPILVTSLPAIVSLIGNGTVVALLAFSVLGLAVGHWLGGPDLEDRTVLALSSATRHPGVALAIAAANVPQQKMVAAAILLYIVVGSLVQIPYLRWLKQAAPSWMQPSQQ